MEITKIGEQLISYYLRVNMRITVKVEIEWERDFRGAKTTKAKTYKSVLWMSMLVTKRNKQRARSWEHGYGYGCAVRGYEYSGNPTKWGFAEGGGVYIE